jgi:hypothetical protein
MIKEVINLDFSSRMSRDGKRCFSEEVIFD